MRTVRYALWAAGLVLFGLFSQNGSAKTFLQGPKAYYLALGDSITWGATPVGPAHSFADDLATVFARAGMTEAVNLGCPGETTTTFIHGGCPSAKINRYPYTGPQLAAALAFLHQHPGEVSPVTVEIGYNDPSNDGLLLPRCTLAPEPMIAAALVRFDANLRIILHDLSSALRGTGDLVVTNNYVATQNTCPASNVLQREFNSHLAASVAAAHATLVPIYDLFNTRSGQSAALCRLTWICSQYVDIHPNIAGQMAIAQRILEVTGYARRAMFTNPQ